MKKKLLKQKKCWTIQPHKRTDIHDSGSRKRENMLRSDDPQLIFADEIRRLVAGKLLFGSL